MMNKARITDIAKSVAIAFLSLSAVFLFLMAMNISPAELIKGITTGAENAPVSSSAEGVDSITPSVPYVIMLTNEDGMHFAAKYDYQAKLKTFSQFSVTLGEALGSASTPTQISETEWRDALSETGVFFDYLYPLPLSLIARQLGTQIPEDLAEISVRRLCLATQGDNLCLYYVSSANDSYFRLDTALTHDFLSLRLLDTELPQGGFAFESDKALAVFDPYFVLSGETIGLSAVQSVSPFSSPEEAQSFLNSFSMNAGTSQQYPEGSGTLAYVDGKKTLRVGANGTVLFTITGTDGIPVTYSGDAPALSDYIKAAASLISGTIGAFSGDASIGLTGIEETANGNGCTLMFSYYVNGTPILLSNTGWCAKITITDANIVRAEMTYREYSVQGELLSVLPEKQELIISVDKGVTPQLFYVDTLGALTAAWYSY